MEEDTQPALPQRPPAREPRQRWRLVYARDADAELLAQRDLAAALDAALAGSDLPLVVGDGPRRRSPISFGAPLPVRMTLERELADLYLAERLPVHEVRHRVMALLPRGFHLLGLHDVWLGEAPLPAQVAAADYRITLEAGGPDADVLAGVAARLLAADTLPRTRPKGGGSARYDLRPLLVDLRVTDPGPPVVLLARTRFHNELGTGRPEEVVAALGEAAGVPIEVGSIVRERLVLADEL